jgi:hypothetical protein
MLGYERVYISAWSRYPYAPPLALQQLEFATLTELFFATQSLPTRGLLLHSDAPLRWPSCCWFRLRRSEYDGCPEHGALKATDGPDTR